MPNGDIEMNSVLFYELFNNFTWEEKLKNSFLNIEYIFNCLDDKQNEIQEIILRPGINVFELRKNLDEYLFHAGRIKDFLITAKNKVSLKNNEFYIDLGSKEWKEIIDLHNQCEHIELFKFKYPSEGEVCQNYDTGRIRDEALVFLQKDDSHEIEINTICSRIQGFIKKEIMRFIEALKNKHS